MRLVTVVGSLAMIGVWCYKNVTGQAYSFSEMDFAVFATLILGKAFQRGRETPQKEHHDQRISPTVAGCQ